MTEYLTNKRRIVFMSDFGRRDNYVAICEGVMQSIAPQSSLIHLSHDIPPQSLPAANYCLEHSFAYMPNGSIFCVVVDPGVGSSREGVALELDFNSLQNGTAEDKRYYAVGPNNGVLSCLIKHATSVSAVELNSPEAQLSKPSNTFHGRDIFSPAAAHLANDKPLDFLGSPLDTDLLVLLDDSIAQENQHGFEARIIDIDRFGNLITNLSATQLEEVALGKYDRVNVQVEGVLIRGISSTFSDVRVGKLVAYIGSSNRLEIALRDGSARAYLGVKTGGIIDVHLRSSK